MSNQRFPRPPYRRVPRCVRASGLVGALALTGAIANAQRLDEPRLEARPFVGVYAPTGAQADVFGTTVLLGLQGAIFLPEVTLTSTFFWGRSDDRRAGASRNVDLFQIDWGAEMALLRRPLMWQLRPIVGAGVGVRVYDSHESHAATRRMLVGFAAAGLSRPIEGIDARIELRNHVSRFTGITVTESPSLRNDITLALALSRGFR